MIRTLFISIALLSIYTARAEPLRILTYNVLYGCNHGKASEIGAKWIAEQKPDIVALQELNGFKQESLKNIARKWNHGHAVILKEKGFPVGLTANSEITVILFGDFNCNSPLDQKWLNARPKDEKIIDEKTVKRRAGNSDPDSAVMSQFFTLGLIDLVHAKQPTKELQRGTFATRLLPKYRTDEQRKDKTWRIDFILADRTLAKRCSSARIPRDKEVDLISDHYPVEAVFGE